MELRITCAASLTAAGPGELCSIAVSPGGAKRQFTFKLALPAAPEQLAFALGAFA